jgi:hypothetical protein
MRFGLYEVDFNTQKRTLRDGAKYFQHVVKMFSMGNTTNEDTDNKSKGEAGSRSGGSKSRSKTKTAPPTVTEEL